MFIDSPEVFEMGYSRFVYQGNGKRGRKKDHPGDEWSFVFEKYFILST